MRHNVHVLHFGSHFFCRKITQLTEIKHFSSIKSRAGHGSNQSISSPQLRTLVFDVEALASLIERNIDGIVPLPLTAVGSARLVSVLSSTVVRYTWNIRYSVRDSHHYG